MAAVLCAVAAYLAGDAGGLATPLAWMLAGIHAFGVLAGFMLMKNIRGAGVLAAITALGALLGLPAVAGIILHLLTRG